MTTTAGPVQLSPGDLLEIGVFDTPELSGKVRVNSAGDISLPLIGTLHVGGLTPEQTQSAIRESLIKGEFLKDPQVAVFVAEYANQAVYVTGEVNRPGPYPIMGSHRLMDFIAAAGGVSDRAGKVVTITHQDDPEHPKVVKLEQGAASNPEMKAGDTVVVSQAGIIYILGDVGRPGGFLIDHDEHLTVMQALALAQGVRPGASLKNAKLVRTTDQGRQEVGLDLKQLFEGRSTDLALQDDDILFIPTNVAKGAFKRGLEAVVQAATGLAIYRR
ncbi:MAG: polysaccharide biosynthesis/export family protein [Terriglobales bacterium]